MKRPGRAAPLLAVAIRHSDRPDEIAEDGWSLLQVRPESIGMAEAAERVLQLHRSRVAMLKSINPDIDARPILDIPQDFDPSIRNLYTVVEWHEHNAARNVAFQGPSKSYVLRGEKIFMHYPRVVTRPIPSEERFDLFCLRGHKSNKTRVELVRAACKAFAKSQKGVDI